MSMNAYYGAHYWKSHGFEISEHNNGRHVTIESPTLFLSVWPTSLDRDLRPRWMAFGKSFYAAASR